MADSKKTYKETFGALPSKVDLRDYKMKKQVCGAQEFPETFTLKTRPVKNQRSVSSCVAHSLAEVIEYHDYIQNKCTNKMSTGFIYGNRLTTDYKGEGMYTRDALKAILLYGDCYYEDYPENIEVPKAIELFKNRLNELEEPAYHNRISSYVRLKTFDEIKTSLMKNGPVVFSINWYKDVVVDENGIMQSKQIGITGCHCMIIYGWNKEGWLIQNSWGTSWGIKGRAILPYEYAINESWGVIDNITEDDIKKPFHTKFGRWIARILNTIINFIIGLFRR